MLFTFTRLLTDAMKLRNPFKSRSARPSGTKHASDVPRADFLRAESACLVQRAVCAVQKDPIDDPAALTATLVVAKDRSQGFEEKTRWVLPFKLSSSIDDISALGIGVELYFWQARSLAIVFLLMGCCSLPNLWANYSASSAYVGLERSGTPILVASTLGMRSQAFDLFSASSWELLSTLLFSGYLVWLRWWNSTKAANNNKRFVTSADYTVEVSNLPATVTKADLKQLFEQAPLRGRSAPPKVVNVELPLRASSEMVALVQARRATLRQINETLLMVEDGDASSDELAELRAKAQAQYAALRNRLGAEKGTTCGMAYVTFDTAEDAQAAARTWSLGALQRLWLWLSCQEPVARVHGALPGVRRAAEASDVLWENLAFQDDCCALMAPTRAALTNAVALATLLPCAWLVLVLTRYKLDLASHLTQASLEQAGTASPNDAVAAAAAAAVTFEPPPAPPPPAAWWDPDQLSLGVHGGLDAFLHAMQLRGALGITFVSLIIAASISGLSSGLRVVLKKLTATEHPVSATYHQMRLLTTAAAVLITNYVVLLFAVYTPALQESWAANKARLDELVVSVEATGAAVNDHADAAQLEELYESTEAKLVEALGGSGDYYSQAGLLPQVLILALTDAVFLQLNMAMAVAYPLFYRWWGRNSRSQPMLDHWYAPVPMDIATCYAYMLKTAAICLVFAPAAPLLYFVASLALFAMYGAQKLALVKVFRRPPLLDDEIAERSREFLGVLLLVHSVSAAYFYTAQAEESASDVSLGQSAPLALGLLAWLVYAVVPFEALLRRAVEDEASGTNGVTWTAAVASQPGCLEEYRCPSSEHDVRSIDQKIDRMAVGAFQLQRQLTGTVTPWLFFDRVNDLRAEQQRGCCPCCRPVGDALL